MKIRMDKKRIICLGLVIIGLLMIIPLFLILFGVQNCSLLVELIAIIGTILFHLGWWSLILSDNKSRIKKGGCNG